MDEFHSLCEARGDRHWSPDFQTKEPNKASALCLNVIDLTRAFTNIWWLSEYKIQNNLVNLTRASPQQQSPDLKNWTWRKLAFYLQFLISNFFPSDDEDRARGRLSDLRLLSRASWWYADGSFFFMLLQSNELNDIKYFYWAFFSAFSNASISCRLVSVDCLARARWISRATSFRLVRWWINENDKTAAAAAATMWFSFQEFQAFHLSRLFFLIISCMSYLSVGRACCDCCRRYCTRCDMLKWLFPSYLFN